MKRFKSNWQLVIGLILYTGTLIVTRYVDIPEVLHYVLMPSAIMLEFWGIFKIARSPEMKNSKLRRWKLRLIGREPK